jgi:hypothetical protein
VPAKPAIIPKVASSPTPSATPVSKYPEYTSSIPAAFQGRWDEIVADGCRGREARFMFTANKVFNFEAQSDVSRVKLYSPTEIDIDITGYDDEKNQYNNTMMLKLVDGEKTLTGRKVGASFFHRCPKG